MLGVPKPRLGVPKPRLRAPKPRLGVPKPRLEVPKPRLGDPKHGLRTPLIVWGKRAGLYIFLYNPTNEKVPYVYRDVSDVR